jgi:hypothetical protein
MAARLYTLYKPMRRRLTPRRVVWWVVALGLLFAWWITLAPGSSASANGSGATPPASRRAP